jgi:hypothetical protein
METSLYWVLIFILLVLHTNSLFCDFQEKKKKETIFVRLSEKDEEGNVIIPTKQLATNVKQLPIEIHHIIIQYLNLYEDIGLLRFFPKIYRELLSKLFLCLDN